MQAFAGLSMWVIGLVTFAVGVRLLLVATWRIFRPQETWAQAACIGGSVAVLAVFGLRVASGELSTAQVHTPAMGLFFIIRLVLFAWMSFESLRYYGMPKRRLALGLADPLTIITLLSIASSLTMWCAFFPPEMMRRRVSAIG